MNLLRTIGLIIAITAVFPRDARANPYAYDPPWNVRLLGQIGGACGGIAVAGSYAYIGEGGNLTILDVANPSAPVVVGRCAVRLFRVLDLKVKDGLAYVGGGAYGRPYGLQIVDVKNPRQPRLVGFYPIPGWVSGVYVEGNLAYLTWFGYGSGGLRIVDVSNPSSPTLRGLFDTGDWARDVYVSSGTAYIASTYGGLHIVDVTNPSRPRRIGRYGQGTECNAVCVRGRLVYTSHGGTMDIVDVTTPLAPTRRGTFQGFVTYNIFVSDGLAYLADGANSIVDVANPSSPTLRAMCPEAGPAADITVSSRTAYVTKHGGGFAIINVKNSYRPVLCAKYQTLSDLKAIEVVDGVAYVANGGIGMTTVDVRTPQSPVVLGSIAMSSASVSIRVSAGRAYLAGRGGLHLVDVTNPRSLRWLGSYSTRGDCWRSAVSGDLAYAIHWDQGLLIIDVTKPSSPRLKGSFSSLGWPWDVSLSGHLAFVNDLGPIKVIDVSNPASPTLRATTPWGLNEMSNVFSLRGRLYLAGVKRVSDATNEFRCLDVTNPDAAQCVGAYTINYGLDPGKVYVGDGKAYAIINGLHIFDIRNPSNPVRCGYYPEGNGGVFAVGDLIYLADDGGLRIIQYTGPTPARHWQLYP